MRHDWILDMLTDLRLYALRNNLPDTAKGAENLMRLVRAEVVERGNDDDGGGAATGDGQAPPRGLPH